MTIKGKDIELFVRRDDTWVNIACALSASLSVDAETIPITTIDSGREDEYEGGATNATIDFSGVMTLDQTSMWQYHEFAEEVGNKHRFLYVFTDSNDLSRAYDMYGIITNVNSRGDFADFGLFDVSVLRSGPMTVITENEDGFLIDHNGDIIFDHNGDPISG